MLRSLAAIALLAAVASAQSIQSSTPLAPASPRERVLLPSVGGRWDGPYSPPVISTGEITHAVYVPPNDAGGAPVGQILFIANQYRNCANPFDPAQHTQVWHWDPAAPGAIASVDDVPNSMRESLWCSGHALAPNGDWWVVGGTDMTMPCYTGSSGIYRWAPASGWTAMTPLDPLAPRWYPCAIQIGSPTGTQFLVLGHEQKPIGPEETHQILDVATGTVGALYLNQVADDHCQPTASRASLGTYPWTHWLCTGMPFVTGPMADEKYFGCPLPGGGFRWIRGTPGTRMREAGNSVHFLDWTAAGRQESIYILGGLSSFLGPGGGSGLADWYVLDSMESIHAPAVGAGSTWSDEPSMEFDRRHAVSVQLPNGDFIALGGIGWDGPSDPSGVKVPRTTPELFDRAKGAWRRLNAQVRPRTYHSVAVLLRDGRIVSAGGVLDPQHTVEIYSPPYLFRGPRPTVVRAPTSIGYCATPPCATFTFTVEYGEASDAIRKVTLLRPSSITHGFDENQRYVELGIASRRQPDPLGQPLRWDLEVLLPEDWNVAPPGWYMLFAVSAQGVPTIGEWLRVI
ncbi:MAG: DUF1929 domain-containing protein [Planctomycetes bacterium]|nr:DUF1929 domain-containing protein [Planctomycetota bacterium]